MSVISTYPAMNPVIRAMRDGFNCHCDAFSDKASSISLGGLKPKRAQKGAMP